MKPFTRIASLLFALIALAHIYRLLRPFEVAIAGHQISQLASLVGALVAGTLAVMLHRECKS